MSLRRVVDLYREAVAVGDWHPTKTVAEGLGYSRGHISRLLSQARREGLLGPAHRGVAGEFEPTKPTVCLLHADVRVMTSACWSVAIDWYTAHPHLTGDAGRDAYQAEAEQRMLNGLRLSNPEPT